MSKMPAKKKSCFQITSVTQAQVAANSATDDTESLDDPDESRTEDVSSEIFDMCRTEVCDRSSSEETLNNVGDSEGQTPQNGGFGTRTLSHHQGIQASGTQTAQVTSSSSATTITSCTSRFRVIKLDHGTGEPFRRGRWTCMEFYEKDPEGSVMSRTVDSIRHTNVTEPGADRDSGLGATVGSIMATDVNSDGSNKPVPPSAQHSLHPPAHEGGHLQKSPSIPPSPQVQPLLYQPQPALVSTSQPDYGQRSMPIAANQTLPGVSLSAGHVISQGSSPLPNPATGGVSVAPMPSIQHQQQPVAQYQASGVMHGLSTALQSAQSLPVAPVTLAVGSPNTSAHSQASQVPRNGTAAGMGTSVFSQTDESRRMSDASAQVHSKDTVMPLITEGLQLPSPAVSSLFAAQVTMYLLTQSVHLCLCIWQAFPLSFKTRFSQHLHGKAVLELSNSSDLVKSHLMYAVREEVEVLKEQIKELYERNSVLERENAVLKSLANNEQLSQLPVQSSSSAPVPGQAQPQPQPQPQPYLQLDSNQSADSLPPQPSVTST
uniref:TSC22 domain family, member 2 n=1 Tax=Cyprinus carpio TaxID=7962 RepID=A0A8C1UR51_CYPCA